MTAGTLAPTVEQRRAIEAPLGPVLIVAGAGTGKTWVMAQRILHLVGSGQARPGEILALTFSNKAAFHLKQKVRDALGPDADVAVATYHSFGAALVADHALDLGLAPGTRLLDRAQAWQLLYQVFDEFRFEQRSALAPAVVLSDALTLASRAADYLVPVAAIAADSAFVAREGRWKPMRTAAASRLELCQVVEAYERRKRERSLMDYGDQVALAVRLLETRPGVAAAERARHPVVLLDEYQDTNYAQRRLLQLLYPPGSAVTAVGDDMQSIYAFRGAHLFNIQHFGDHFAAAGAEARSDELQVTFRFGRPLADVANRIQAQVGDALPKTLEPAPGAGATTVECFLAADEAEEAATIADGIAESHAAGAPWRDHAVLCRKRRLIQPIVDALDERGVPSDVVGTSGLLDRPEVVDLVAWIEVLADPAAVVALLRILRGRRYHLGRRDLAALARHSRALRGQRDERCSVADALEDLEGVPDLSPAARARLGDYRRERAELATLATRVPLLDLAETIVLRTGLWQAGGRARENLLRFLDLAEGFEPVEGDPGLAAFLEYLQLLDESEEDVAEAHTRGEDAVRISTVHQAKGLEFPVVYVPGLAGRGSSRLFPDDRAHENALSNASALPWWLRADDEGIPDPRTVATQQEIGAAVRRRRLAEEWRLLYVACTRARRRLICSAAHWYAGPSQPQGPSEFYEFIASLAAEGLVTERFRHGPAEVDPDVAAKQRRRESGSDRYAAAVASDPAQLRLEDIAVSLPSTAPSRRAPAGLSVTHLVAYARCPKQFYWTVVRPLPRRSSPAARIGTAVHRWIEQRAGRQLVLLEPDAVEAGEPGGGEPAVAAALKASFLASPWAELDPERVEAPFVLRAGRHVLRGRIDAVYRRDGRLELVDFKTGRPAPPGDVPTTLQLNLYGLAAVDAWGADPDELRTTYCYLRTGGRPALMSADWDAGALDAVRADLAATLDQVAAERFDPTPGRWCHRCDFLPACRAGQRWVGA